MSDINKRMINFRYLFLVFKSERIICSGAMISRVRGCVLNVMYIHMYGESIYKGGARINGS